MPGNPSLKSHLKGKQLRNLEEPWGILRRGTRTPRSHLAGVFKFEINTPLGKPSWGMSPKTPN